MIHSCDHDLRILIMRKRLRPCTPTDGHPGMPPTAPQIAIPAIDLPRAWGNIATVATRLWPSRAKFPPWQLGLPHCGVRWAAAALTAFGYGRCFRLICERCSRQPALAMQDRGGRRNGMLQDNSGFRLKAGIGSIFVNDRPCSERSFRTRQPDEKVRPNHSCCRCTSAPNRQKC